jgi:hypothetical protein
MQAKTAEEVMSGSQTEKLAPNRAWFIRRLTKGDKSNKDVIGLIPFLSPLLGKCLTAKRAVAENRVWAAAGHRLQMNT